jgi:glyoxylate reductase
MKVVVTRALPPATLAPLADLGELWVSSHGRPREHLQAIGNAEA